MSYPCRLCYVRMTVADMAAAERFATDFLGLEPTADCDGVTYWRSDQRHHTLAFASEGPAAVGIEVENLESVVARLVGGSFPVRRATPSECATRFVKAAAFTHDPAGNVIELVERPMIAARRFFPPVDTQVVGLDKVALRSTDIAADTIFWTDMLGADVADWVGDIVYLRLDGGHHQIALYPSDRNGILYQSYKVHELDSLMRNLYRLRDYQIEIVQGPGRESVSGDMFLRFRGPDASIFAFVANESSEDDAQRKPRQFEHGADALCAWGSRCETVPELKIEGL